MRFLFSLLPRRRAAEPACGGGPDGGWALRRFVDRVSDHALCTLDPDGRVHGWNTGAERLTGYAAPEIVGQPAARFHTEEDQASGVPARALRTAERDGTFEAEGWRVRKDGHRFWTHETIDAVRDGGGALVGFAVVVRDLSERRAAQHALARAEAELLQVRTARCFTHDFNNLLQGLSACLHAVEMRSSDPALRPFVDAGQQAVQRAAALVRRIKAAGRPPEASP